MRRNEYTITVKNGYFGNTAISAVRLDNNISIYHFTLSGKDVFPGCTYQVQYERPDGVSAIAVPETQSFGSDGTLTLDWIPSGDLFAVSGTGKIKLYAVDADGTQMWNSHLADYHVCETLDPSDNTSIAIPPDELATYVAKAVESARKASDSEANAKASEARAGEYAESASASATSASASATNASASEVNAKFSETNASASASSARASAETATEQATIATTKAQGALASATSAEQSAQEAEGSKEAAGASADGAARTYSKVQESLSQMRSYVESAEGTLGEMKALAYTGGVMAMDVEQKTFTMKIACRHGRLHLYLSTVQTS